MKSNIIFQPHVGGLYQKGGGVFKKRTLILGGSLYGVDETRSDATQELVDFYLTRCGESWCKTYTSFINSVFGRDANQEERERFFQSIVFYTYLQAPAGAGPHDAGKSDYSDNRHFAAFCEVLDAHQPEVVIAWGDLVWDALPDDWNYGNADRGEPMVIAGESFSFHYNYPYRDGRILLIGAHHPSIGYSRDFHHALFKQLGVV